MLYKKLEKVAPETDYGYTVVGTDSFVKNCKRYSLKNLVNDKYKKNCSYISGLNTFGDSSYFFGLYDSRKNSDWDTGDYWTYDLAIFRLDWNTLQIAEEVYDFKNISPIFKHPDGYDSNPDFGNIISNDRAVMRYNGALHILDLQQKEIIYSVDISGNYAKRRYSGYNLENGDYYIHTGDYLYYYEYDNDCFTLHEYESAKNYSGIERLDNYVYTYSYDTYDNTNKVYCDCFDLTTDECVNSEEIEALATQKEAEQALNNTYVLQGNTYLFEYDNETLKISSDTTAVTINEEYMLEHSQKFVDLYDFWTKGHNGYKPVDWTVVEEKVFVSFSAEYGFTHTPAYIYEYDPTTENVYYVGFSTSQRLSSFWLDNN
ncbi:MAG: hypothetical protein ACI4MN_06085 [Candidatus Coproplasma sp.]